MSSPNKKMVEAVSKAYPGRASAAPVVDLLITLLSMGGKGYKSLLKKRKELMPKFVQQMASLAEKHGERMLHTPGNQISFSMTLDSFTNEASAADTAAAAGRAAVSATYLGSMLFSRNVSGTRIVARGGSKAIGGYEFPGYGAHVDDYPNVYMTAACAIGMEEEEVSTQPLPAVLFFGPNTQRVANCAIHTGRCFCGADRQGYD
jgi:O-phospho-L-seryl-tRNASec:L-selenocysteinyl-tRNA synthase